MMTVQLPMPYIGKSLSVNHYKFRNGHTKPETRKWMNALTITAQYHLGKVKVKYPPTIHLSGVFKDNRSCPDLHNLHKVIGDALQPVLGNDREFRFVDEGYTLSLAIDPILVIGVETEEDGDDTAKD